MCSFSRRDFIQSYALASAGVWLGHGGGATVGDTDVHHQLLELAERQEKARRSRFAAVKSRNELTTLQRDLRAAFLRLIGGLPEQTGVPPRKSWRRSMAATIWSKNSSSKACPAISFRRFSTTEENPVAPARGSRPVRPFIRRQGGETYQILHINLAKRGYVVLTYDPVGQGERSQFWDAAKRPFAIQPRAAASTRFWAIRSICWAPTSPVTASGTACAAWTTWPRSRRWMRSGSAASATPAAARSPPTSRPSIRASRPPRSAATSRRCRGAWATASRTTPTPTPSRTFSASSAKGSITPGLLALLAPRPTLLGTAQLRFLSHRRGPRIVRRGEALFEIAGAGERIEQRRGRREARPDRCRLRQAVYGWFDRWLAGQKTSRASRGDPGQAAAAKELLVCADGQVNVTFRSRQLLPLAWRSSTGEPKPRAGKPSGAASARSRARRIPS